MGTVIGTPTNVVLFGLVTDTYGPETTLSFGTWAAYGIPLSLILLLFVWAILGMIFIGPKKFFACKNPDKSREAAIRQILDEEKRSLGPIEWAEGSAIGILAVIVVLWVTRKPGVDGWAALVPSGFNKDGKSIPLTTDTQAAVLGTILVCAWPANNPFRRRQPTEQDIDPLEPVLPWKVAQSRCPWQVLFLIGGGFCLSRMCTVSQVVCSLSLAVVHEAVYGGMSVCAIQTREVGSSTSVALSRDKVAQSHRRVCVTASADHDRHGMAR
uniref:CitMHS domain-containing protein n=1 Tax=Mesocestoides corti TaxID=53468 RepID=A0A5K3EKZ8_MESCO